MLKFVQDVSVGACLSQVWYRWQTTSIIQTSTLCWSWFTNLFTFNRTKSQLTFTKLNTWTTTQKYTLPRRSRRIRSFLEDLTKKTLKKTTDWATQMSSKSTLNQSSFGRFPSCATILTKTTTLTGKVVTMRSMLRRTRAWWLKWSTCWKT